MILFTKRRQLKEKDVYRLSEHLKSRLLTLIGLCIKNGFLEECLLKYFWNSISWLHEENLWLISRWWLGYDLNKLYDPNRLEFDNWCENEWYIFDLLELLIIFCKEEKREEFIKRIRHIFDEEQGMFTYSLHWYIIIQNDSNEFKSILPFIKDEKLRKKLVSYFEIKWKNTESSILAKASADIINYLLSSEEGEFKNFMEQLFQKIWEKLSIEKPEELAQFLLKHANQSKGFNNKIDDVRHTERSTIPIIQNSGIYKFIADNNMSLIELIITSLPEEYLSEWSPGEIKSTLLSTFSIDVNSALRISVDESPFEL